MSVTGNGNESGGLGYEINLECAACGHAQFLHCDHTGGHGDDPCGCFGGVKVKRHTVEQTCRCTEFIRPPGAVPPPDGVWMEHDHKEAG